MGRNIFAYFFVAVLIIGTVSTVFIASTPASTPASDATPTTNPSSFLGLVTQADTELASGKYENAIGLYNAYLSQNATDADVLFKLGKAYVSPQNPTPDYLSGVDYLQRAVTINGSAAWAAEAFALISQYQPQAQATATAISASAAVTGTATIASPSLTATTVITK
ncbi:MAG: hypothetical protein ABI670_13840 [Chloroflexota bacterium]